MSASHHAAAVLFSFVLTWAVGAGPNPTRAGLDESQLSEIPKRLEAFIADGDISGAVTLVARQGHLASLEAVGYADLVERKPMHPDSLFWIASMTKPITATAVLMLQDEGKLSVEDSVEKYLPEFKNQWLVAERGKDALQLRRPLRPITLRDLLTHTSGLGDAPDAGRDLSLAELTLAYSQQPLQFEPGSKWQYSNPGINTLGRVVEVVARTAFPAFLEQRLFRPLGMKDTTFYPSAGQLRRLAKSYRPREDGQGLEETGIPFFKGDLLSRKRTPFPAGGLFSTAPDLFRFYQMVLNGGSFKGRPYVSRASVGLMTRTQTGDLKTGFTDGMSFGFGWAVVREPAGVTAMLSPGTFGHGGAYGTNGWVDPAKEMILVLMIQRAKLPNADASPVRHAFQDAAVKAVLR